jgi:hypothetical protein
LVFKLGVKPDLTPDAVNGIISYYRGLSLPHRCKLAVITEYLTDEQMVELTRASTFHLNATRAEGANLPLQDFLAAGRPGVSPRHTAMCDYFHDEMGFVVASHPEPTRWPHLPELGLTTSWHHPVWESLCAQLQASYETAKQHPRAYQIMASRSREQIEDYASAERVWPRLVAALNAAARDLVQPQPREAPADARREPRPGVPTHANG